MNFAGRKSIVSTENPKSIAAMWAFLLFWCAFSGGMFYVWAFQAGDVFGSAISGFFLLVGLAMLPGAARKTLDYAKFGAVRLTVWILLTVLVIASVVGISGLLGNVPGGSVVGLAPQQAQSSLPRTAAAGAPRALATEAGPEASAFEVLPTGDTLAPLHRAMSAAAAGRYDEAGRLFQEALNAAERNQGRASPTAALVHFQVSLMHQRRKDFDEQERALQRALAIMEQYSDAELKQTPGWGQDGVDVAMITADLGYIYWEWRRYADAYAWYERAHQAAPGLSTTEYNRNRRLAISSAGVMASACTLGKWDVADRAMAELKQRMPRVDAELRRWLDYWVRTGEPRLKARRC